MGETGQLLRLLKRKAFDAHMQWKQPANPVLKNSLPHAKLAKLATSQGASLKEHPHLGISSFTLRLRAKRVVLRGRRSYRLELTWAEARVNDSNWDKLQWRRVHREHTHQLGQSRYI